ncbi:PQQ-dependent sugar dehydrogenase [Zavarzinia compransoris]|uniref:PQQ-dependent sugar dehydrogenase n=1 Tax=Zavarzinia compransoris TaxID=1264899 RepID=UPI0010F0A1F8|nr:PQQ-dependent sugar dehydrogenase [Zavarzinia compransoris]TDP43831.1 glucose/arabinose dehydrogenase [Zavarzinia compransoris]
MAAVIVTLAAQGPALAAPGETIAVDPAGLPPPHATSSAYNAPREVDRPAGAVPSVPPGFNATLFADGLSHARALIVAPDGAVLLAQSRDGVITRLVDADGDGRAETRSDYVTGLDLPHGLAFQGDRLFIADAYGVWQLPYRSGPAAAQAPERITAEGDFGETGGHWTRNLAFGADGRQFFVAIGSEGNLAEEAEPRATIRRYDAAGGKGATFAAGLRNPVGLAVHPETGALWTVVNERDGLGDDLVPDYLAEVVEGGFYGWPYAYLGLPDPRFGDRRPDLVAKSRQPEVLFRSHSAPLGLVFYTGDRFPAEYQGDAFVALHGSWNAGVARGYQVARVDFAGGRPVANRYEIFVDGFRTDAPGGPGRASVWGRPAGLAVAADGALLVADDAGGTLWHIAYKGQ